MANSIATKSGSDRISRMMLTLMVWLGLVACRASGIAGSNGDAAKVSSRRVNSASTVTVRQNFTQVLLLAGEPLEFNDDEVQSYQLLLAGYTDHFLGPGVSTPELAASCNIWDQGIVSLYGRNETQKILLTVSFEMRYESQYGIALDEYPAYFREHINSDLVSVMADMRSRSLPVVQAMEVTVVGDLVVISPPPTSEPTPDPTTSNPTAELTSTPSKGPSSIPTRSPTLAPTREVTDGVSTASQAASSSPDEAAKPKRTYVVPSTMTFFGSDRLDEDATKAWAGVTLGRIRDEATSILDGKYDGLVVAVSLDGQQVLADRRNLAQMNDSIEGFVAVLRGSWRKLQSAPRLQLVFTTNVQFESEQETWDPNKMISSGFRTQDQQREYIKSLIAADGVTFGGLKGMKMEVDGELITESAEPEVKTRAKSADAGDEYDGGGNSVVSAIIGAIVAVAAVLLLLAFVLRKREIKEPKPTEPVISEGSLAEPDVLGVQLVKEDADDTSSNNSHEEEEEKEDAIYDRITVVAPAGKLGLVISNPRRDMPIIVQMKVESVMRGKVQVGDLLVTVDEVDCQGMSSSDVSELICSRSQETERTLVLLREQ